MNAEIKALDVQIASGVKELEKTKITDVKRLDTIRKLTDLLLKQNELLKQKTDKIIRNEKYN